MKMNTFLRKNGDLPKRVVDFPRERDTLRNKIMEIVEDFTEQSYNHNGKPWKSSRILRVKPKTFEIFGDFAIFEFFIVLHFLMLFLLLFLHFSLFSIFLLFSFYFFVHFLLSFIFSFFPFFNFSCFVFPCFSFLLLFLVFFFFHLLFFSIFSSSFLFFIFLFPVIRADAKTRKKSSRSSYCKKGQCPFVKIRLLGFAGQGVRSGTFDDFAFKVFLLFFSRVFKI